MAVNNRYFPHDSNAKDDPKCVLLIDDMGMEGYGIYWMLIEVLREQPDYSYPIANAMALARRYNTSTESVRQVIYKYDLFVVEEDRIFFSESLNRRMAEVEARALRRTEASLKANQVRWHKNANGMPTDSERTPNGEQSDSERTPNLSQYKSKSKYKLKDKENTHIVCTKESATSVRFTPPSIEEVRMYVREASLDIDAEEFIDYGIANGWKLSNGNPMKDWRATLRQWNRRKNQQKENQQRNDTRNSKASILHPELDDYGESTI